MTLCIPIRLKLMSQRMTASTNAPVKSHKRPRQVAPKQVDRRDSGQREDHAHQAQRLWRRPQQGCQCRDREQIKRWKRGGKHRGRARVHCDGRRYGQVRCLVVPKADRQVPQIVEAHCPRQQ